MYKLIDNINKHPYFLFSASFSSILGLLLSVYIVYKSWNISKLLNHMETAKDYNLCRTQFIQRFKGHKSSILIDENYSKQIVHDILEDVFRFEVQYKPLLSNIDLFKFFFIKHYLKKRFNNINFDKICNYLDYLIGRNYKKEDE
ncbi:hypothetical protein [Clostridium estertheticum]|uniref:hypothetical protein n=1 Tax=Clostridium estertheticum TaxID=238834 RepID=UPI001C7CA5C3|nr:hypothetical protein [Clostridium estertheticum]MBX4265899.1 hypothetical protein [Clostridium estertheticum]WLC90174.1 hypothetical protein KTC95_08325 [Clostridium estertheticum]